MAKKSSPSRDNFSVDKYSDEPSPAPGADGGFKINDPAAQEAFKKAIEDAQKRDPLPGRSPR